MKKIILGLTLFASLLFSYDKWKDELIIQKGVFNMFSDETSKYFCEHKDKPALAKEILEHFKSQNINYYYSHKDAIDNLPMKLIESTEKNNYGCPPGYKVSGSCGHLTCFKEVNSHDF